MGRNTLPVDPSSLQQDSKLLFLAKVSTVFANPNSKKSQDGETLPPENLSPFPALVFPVFPEVPGGPSTFSWADVAAPELEQEMEKCEHIKRQNKM